MAQTAVYDFNPDKLLRIRLEKGLSQIQLSERSGAAQQTIWKLENGEYTPSRTMLGRLAKGLGIAPNELIGPEQEIVEEIEKITRYFEIVRKMAL